MSAAAGSEPSIRSAVLGGFAWKLLSQVVVQASRVVVLVILARLLTPHEFGLAGMVLVFSALVYLFTDLALGAALIQRPHLTEQDRSTAFWTSAATGFALMLVGIGLSGVVADFYGEPAVRGLFAVLSVSFLVNAVAATQFALLSKEMRFRSLEIRFMIATVAGAAVGIGAALKGWGAWAIIAQQLAISLVSTALIWKFSSWRPTFTFSRASLRSLGGYSGNVFLSRLLLYVKANLDNLLVGRFLGPAALGAYAVSYNIVVMPTARVARPIVEVLFPAFARMQADPAKIGSIWLRGNRLVAAVSLPALLGLAVVAPDFVTAVLGTRWDEATPVIQILAAVGLLLSLERLNGSVLQARDRTGTLLAMSLMTFVATGVAFVLGLQWGIVGVAACYAVATGVTVPVFVWVTGRAVGVTLWAFLRNLSGVVQASAGMTVCVLGAWALLLGLPAGARLAIEVVLGIVTFGALLFWRAPEVVAEVRGLRRSRRVDADGVVPGTGRSVEVVGASR